MAIFNMSFKINIHGVQYFFVYVLIDLKENHEFCILKQDLPLRGEKILEIV